MSLAKPAIIGLAGDFGVGKTYLVNILRNEVYGRQNLISQNLQDGILLRIFSYKLLLKTGRDLEKIRLILENFHEIIDFFKLKRDFIIKFVELVNKSLDFYATTSDSTTLEFIFNQFTSLFGLYNLPPIRYEKETVQQINAVLKSFFESEAFSKDNLILLKNITLDIVEQLKNENVYHIFREKIIEEDYEILINISSKVGIDYIFQYIYSAVEFEKLKNKGTKIIYIENDAGSHLIILENNYKDRTREEKIKALNSEDFRRKQNYFKANADSIIKNNLENDLILQQKILTQIAEQEGI